MALPGDKSHSNRINDTPRVGCSPWVGFREQPMLAELFSRSRVKQLSVPWKISPSSKAGISTSEVNEVAWLDFCLNTAKRRNCPVGEDLG